MRKYCIAILSALLLTTGLVYGQGSTSIGPQVGFYKVRDADNTNIMPGAALRVGLGGLGVEGSVNYRRDNYDNDHVTVTSWPVMVTGLLYPVPVLYGAVGAGWYNSSIEYKYPAGYNGGPGNMSTENVQRFGWHFGGGAEIPLATTAKLVGDIRYVFLDYDFQAIPGTSGLNSDFYVITAGLLFQL